MPDIFRGPLEAPKWAPEPVWFRGWTVNLLQTTLKPAVAPTPVGEQVYDLPPQPVLHIYYRTGLRTWAQHPTSWLIAPFRADSLPNYDQNPPPPLPDPALTWISNPLTLRSIVQQPVGEQSTALPGQPDKLLQTWSWQYNSNLIGQDKLPTGEQIYDLPPKAYLQPADVRLWAWRYNLNLIGKDAMVAGEQVFDLPPRDIREFRAWSWQYNLNLIGQDRLPVGEQSYAVPTGVSWYQTWVLNLLQSTLTVINAPVGAQAYDRPQLATPVAQGWAWTYNINLIGQDKLPIGEVVTALPPAGYLQPVDVTKWAWKYNLNLIGKDALPVGDQSYALVVPDNRERRDWNINLVLTTLLGQDRMTSGVQIWSVPPIGPPPLVPSWTWQYNPNLVGQDKLPVGAVSTKLVPGPDWLLGWASNLLQTTLAPSFARPFNQFDWPVPKGPQQPAITWTWQYNPNLVAQDAMIVGEQSYALTVPEPQRPVQLNNWVWQYNLNLIGKDALPVGARVYDQPSLRVFWQRGWEINLVLSTLLGQDRLPTGKQSYALAPQPPISPAQVWTWQYNPNLVGQDVLPTGDQRFELVPPAPPRPDGTWVQSLVAALTAATAKPIFVNQWDWTVPKAPLQPALGWTASYNLNLIGQDQLPVGEQSYARPQLDAPQFDRSFTSSGLSLLTAPIVFTVGEQIYDLTPRGFEYPVDLRSSIPGTNINLFPPPPPPVVVVTAIVGDPYDRRKRYRFSQPFAPMDRWQYEEMLNFLAKSKMNASERAAFEEHRRELMMLTDERDIEFLMLDGVL